MNKYQIKSYKNWRAKKKSSFSFKKGLFKKIILYLFVLAVILFLAGAVLGSAAIAWFSRDLPNPDRVIQRNVAQSTIIYDREGKTILYQIHGEEKRTLVELDQISNYAKWAVIAIEDKNFYKHRGFSLRGIIRAFWANIVKGDKTQGGSTITQQFIKNSILSSEKTYTRKIKELVLAYRIEKKFSKDQILKMYLNEIPYGSMAYGTEAASQVFFQKNAKDLDLAESSLLAALPRATTYYSPYGAHTDKLIQRQQYIIDQMVEGGYIKKEEGENAKKTNILKKVSPRKEGIIAPHFVMYIKEYLTEKYGERIVEQGGLKVYTTLDLYKQKIAEEAIKKGAERNKAYGAKNASLVALDPKTGQILAMVGSKDYFDKTIDGNVNIALSPRQPGSSFKPIVYAASFLKGYTPETILYDVETNFETNPEKKYIPKNYDKQERGPVSIRKALAGSLNIPAVKTIYLTGIDQVLDLADKLGYSTLKDRSRFGLSLVLGGGEVKLLEHVSAFSVFAREGEKFPVSGILKIEDQKGKVLEKWKQPKAEKVIETEAVRQINDILSDNSSRSYVFGEQNFLNLGGRPIAAKTGTTDDYRDGWTIGYTPSLAAGVWAGNNDNSPMGKGGDGSNVAAPIWHEFMKKSLGNTPMEKFKKPEANKSKKAILNGQEPGEIKVKIDKASGKLATGLTPLSQIIEKTYKEVHNILHYLDKENPEGDTPSNPSDDPQYKNWEEGVIQWAKKKGFQQEKPPSEYDDLHTLSNQPTLTIISPVNNSAVNSRNLTFTLQASAPRGVIKKIEYYLDDILIYNGYNIPVLATDARTDSLYYRLSNRFDKGFHSFKAIAYDDIDNSKTETISFNLTAEKEIEDLIWKNPQDSSSFPLGATFDLKISANDYVKITKIDFYYTSLSSSGFIGSFLAPKTEEISLPWKPKEKGNFTLLAKASKNGIAIQSQEILIKVQ